jgi:SAM-dependent methyltransferase
VKADWRISQAESRRRYLEKFDAAECEAYDGLVGTLGEPDVQACRQDLAEVFDFRPGLSVLDAGAGTGALCQVLCSVGGLAVTALEPAPAMLARLRAKPALRQVTAVAGFCDHEQDCTHFAPGTFDTIFSRQLTNGLYDPLAAFRNWHAWLKPSGSVVLVDGRYGRDAWRGRWEEEADTLPLSCTQTWATCAYLLEAAGFRVKTAASMPRTNQSPATRTHRYVIVAVRTGKA